MTIAVIGGSGLTPPPDFALEEAAANVWGAPSAALAVGTVAGRTVAFLPRHGVPHRVAPHRVNYRANIEALAALDVTAILATHTVGGIDPALVPGDLVVPDQIIDYTWGRDHSFTDHPVAEEAVLEHVDFTEPFDAALRARLLEASAARDGGVYGCSQGPRLETAAEIRRMARDGCTLVGMTAMPEAALARERQIPYASLSLVVNPAAGVGPEPVSMAAIAAVQAAALPRLREALWRAVALL